MEMFRNFVSVKAWSILLEGNDGNVQEFRINESMVIFLEGNDGKVQECGINESMVNFLGGK